MTAPTRIDRREIFEAIDRLSSHRGPLPIIVCPETSLRVRAWEIAPDSVALPVVLLIGSEAQAKRWAVGSYPRHAVYIRAGARRIERRHDPHTHLASWVVTEPGDG